MFSYVVISLIVGLFFLFGGYLTCKLGIIQIKDFKFGWKNMMRLNESKSGISSFSAATLAIGGRIGSANIAGVTVAIYLCGYGIIFWLWIATFIGMVISFAETTLSQLFKEYDENHLYLSGPTVYIERGLGKKYQPLAVVYGLLLILSVGLLYVLVHVKVISNTVLAFAGIYQSLPLELFLVVAILIIAIYILVGGPRKVAKTTAYVIPVITISYMLLVLIIALEHISFIPKFIELAFTSAFSSSGILGGSILSVIVISSALSIFSSEAGLGTSTLAAGLANGAHPAEQGLVNMLTIFIDVVVCTLTAFVIMLATTNDVIFITIGKISELTIRSFAYTYQGGEILVVTFVLVFAFTSLITSILYGLQVIKIFTHRSSDKKYKRISLIYLGTVFLIILISPSISLESGLFRILIGLITGLLLTINMYAIFKLRKVVFKVYYDYKKQDDAFKSKDVGLEYLNEKNDIWS